MAIILLQGDPFSNRGVEFPESMLNSRLTVTSDNIEGHRGRVSCGLMTVIAALLCFIPRCI